ncbi:MAG: PatA/PatG family cyanobactin maturation protease [Spirulina sp. SIO3F2]|nr:PatA/PatG family cyanobactin maturation protease [Spirulina sp. SIO3F2]
MGLASCVVGAGDSDCFARATGLDSLTESSVGEFKLGSLPAQGVTASEEENTTTEPSGGIDNLGTDPNDSAPILAEREGAVVGEWSAATLQQLDMRGWLQYTAPPFAVAIPMVESARLDLDAPHWMQAKVSLSRFAYQRPYKGSMVIESPLSKFRIKLMDWRANEILAQLIQPQLPGRVVPPAQSDPETVYQFLNLLWATGFLTVGAEAPDLQLWKFHNLLFHHYSRRGRHDYSVSVFSDFFASHDSLLSEAADGIARWSDLRVPSEVPDGIARWSEFPVVKPPMSDRIVALPRSSLETSHQKDDTLTAVMEKRTSVRQYDEQRPITIEQLGELLYRAARVKEIFTDQDKVAGYKTVFGPDFDWGAESRRPYPSAMYELEIYPVVRHCTGLQAGLYHYNPLDHQLDQLDAPEAELAALIDEARQNRHNDTPQVLLVISARFGRLLRKYRSVAYALVMKHVGVLYQNLYLVAANIGIAPCALGGGGIDGFARATGLDYITESAVGEFVLGSLPNRNVTANEVDDAPIELSTETDSLASDETEVSLAANETTERAELSAIAALEHELTIADVLDRDESVGVTDASTVNDDASIVETETESRPSVASSAEAAIAPAAASALYPHDLDDRISGLADLRNQTLGDPRVTIVILDGDPDHTLSCFEGAEISKVFPYWHPPAEPISASAYETFREIANQEDLTKDEKTEALQAVLPDAVLARILGDKHACHITSTMIGQENTPSPGLAPRCRVINVPINTTEIGEEFMSPLNLARAFELALDLGANIIHCASCRPTQTGSGEEILRQAVQKCQDNNILIVAPAGNDQGECWCLPACLPGVLSVGALKPDGTPYKFSNWGGNNGREGIMAPGGDILGAQPATEEPVRLKGTSMAAPVMTGLCALLASLQLQQGKPIDTEAIRAALLNTATPCDPEVVAEPERCLRGRVNLPGAMNILFGPSVTISFAGEGATRTERAGISAAIAASPPAAPAATDAPIPTLSSSTSVTATPTAVTPSAAHSGHIYALGTLGYDFGDAARYDTFERRMAPVNLEGVMMPADPYDARQMVEHLDRNPDEAQSLIWTLNLDGSPIYVLEPKGAFANDVYEMLLLMLDGQLELENSPEFIEHISIPARRTERTVELFSGEVVPVVNINHPRGMYGWNVDALVDAALTTVNNLADVNEVELREGLTAFLNRVYHDLHNLGQTSRDRALNFTVTNTFQAAATFTEALASRRQLDTIEVEKSPYCRLNSDCWDVVLTFFDPENGRRSRRVFRFTLDVAASLPVTVGNIKQWSIPGKKSIAP